MSTRARIVANIRSYHEWNAFLKICHSTDIKEVKQHMECLNIDINYVNDFSSNLESKLFKIFNDLGCYHQFPMLNFKYSQFNMCLKGTALMYTAVEGNKEVTELLLSQPDIDVNTENSFGLTALTISMIYSDIVSGAISSNERSHSFVITDNYRTYSKYELPTNKRVEFNILANDYIQIFRMLLNCPTRDVNHRDCNGLTVLMIALQLRNEVFIEALLECSDIDLNIKDGSGNTALKHAVYTESYEIVKLLLSHSDTIVDIQSVNSYIRMMTSSNDIEMEIVRLLITHHSFDVNDQCEDGLTALAVSVVNRNTEVMKLLLSRGAVISEDIKIARTSEIEDILIAWKRFLPSLEYRCKDMKFYPKEVKRIGFEWLLVMNRKNILPKDIQFLLLIYIIATWKLIQDDRVYPRTPGITFFSTFRPTSYQYFDTSPGESYKLW